MCERAAYINVHLVFVQRFRKCWLVRKYNSSTWTSHKSAILVSVLKGVRLAFFASLFYNSRSSSLECQKFSLNEVVF